MEVDINTGSLQKIYDKRQVKENKSEIPFKTFDWKQFQDEPSKPGAKKEVQSCKDCWCGNKEVVAEKVKSPKNWASTEGDSSKRSAIAAK